MVRAGRLDDSTLIARHLADMPQVICASPDYLNKHGTPQQPEDLLSHYCVNFFSTSGGRNYPFELMVNSKTRLFLKSWIAVNDAENYVLSALQGAGLIQVPRYHVANELKMGVWFRFYLSGKSRRCQFLHYIRSIGSSRHAYEFCRLAE